MKIVSWNVNGLRSVYQKDISDSKNKADQKNFLDWLQEMDADIICLQEVKAQKDQLPEDLIRLQNYHAYFNCGTKKGFNGVAVYVKEKPDVVKKEIGLKRFDKEGRVLILEFPHLTLINVYLPHGIREEEDKLDIDESRVSGYKLEVYKYLLGYLEKIKHQKVVLIGDFNIAHKEIGLESPKMYQNITLFTVEERKRLKQMIEMGFIDAFKGTYNKKFYGWLPFFKNTKDKNLGWRTDYAFVSKILAPSLKKAKVFSDIKGSDHCPVGIEI